MAISFSGISLLLETPEVEEYLSLYHSLDNLVEQSLGGIPGSGLDDVQNPPYRIADPVRVGVLYWPRDCSRCATFHCVVNSTKLDQIRTAVDSSVYQTLSLSDGVNDLVTCSMRMLPPRPLFQIDGTEQLYLLSLVDQRYDFTHHRAGSVETQPISWSALFSTVSSVLGESISAESVDSGYGTPSERWVKFQRPIAALTDAACSTIGQKFIANRDGTYETVGWESAQAASDFQFTLYRKCGGGAIQQADIKRAVPTSVNVVFLEEDSGVPQTAPYVVTKNLVDLAISEYGDTVGIADNVQTIYADLIYDGSNASACESYAIAAATDWYGWQLCDLDVTWAGIVPWEPTGAEDYIEWTYSLTGPGPRLTTRIQRGPWDGFPTGFGQVSTGSQGPEGPRGKPGPVIQPEDGLDGEGFPGPRGKQGIQGIRGKVGPAIPGEDGLDGEQGFPGVRGRPGPTGERGRAGYPIPGEAGLDGESGPPGRRGEQGPEGQRGRQGYPIPGEDGEQGEQGIPGRRGLQGLEGQRGRTGQPIPGEDGQDTEQIYLIKKTTTTQQSTQSSWKEPVRAATTQSGTLSSSFENGDTIDGVTLATGDRILIKNQSSAAENGIYVVNASGAPTRATDADTGSELLGATVVVSEGTVNADTVWVCTTNSTITIGSSNIAWAPLLRSPTPVTDNAVVRYSGTTGAVASVAPATITDTGGGTLTVSNASISNVTVGNRTTFSSTASGGNVVFDESTIVYPPDVSGSYMCLLQGAVGFRFDSGRSRVINTGDFEIPTTASGFGLVLTDSTGARWRLTVNTLGSLVITAIP